MNPRPLRPSLAWSLAAVVLLGLGFATYRTSLEVPFLWDDLMTIVDNPRIRSLSPEAAGEPALQTTDAGRPVVRASLALNYHLGALEFGADGFWTRLLASLGVGGGALAVRGYHLFNLGVHVLVAVLLAAVVRRTLVDVPRWREPACALALFSAALVLVHPLQSEAVTYVVQRTELLMACFFLATLLAAIRARDEPRRPWSVLAVACCVLGMACKEVMAAAPLVVALHDRAFAYPDWRAAWRRRRGLYLGLASTWLVLAALIAMGPRDDSVGFGLGVPWWRYALLQVGVLGDYLRLALWPRGLCFDYGTVFSSSPGTPGLGLVALALVLAGTVWALVRRPRLAFLPAAALLVLAPSSSIVPIVPEIGAERRMYLPLAALVVPWVLGLYELTVAAARRSGGSRAPTTGRVVRDLALVLVPLVASAAFATRARLADYRSGLALWRDAAQKRPDNPRARNHLGRELFLGARPEEALLEFAAAVKLAGCEIEAFHNLGHALAAVGRLEDAARHFEELVRTDPRDCRAHEGLGAVALEREDWVTAETALRACLALGCGTAGTLNNLAKALFFQGRGTEAVAAYEQALALDPANAEAAENLRRARALLEERR
jgi:Flp pilus assembly protein TadD